MTSKERVRAAMRYKKPDKVPVQYYYCPVGYYEHGEKLNDLYAQLEGDFEPFRRVTPAGPAAGDYDADGSYHGYRRDDWGTLWEYRIFGITGIPKEYPLAEESKIAAFKAPQVSEAAVADAAERARVLNELGFYNLSGCGSLYERLIALRPEADVLCDIISGEDYINRLADIIMEHDAVLVKAAVDAGADGIAFGDDYGLEHGLIMSPELWRSFFKPRLASLFKPAIEAGMEIHFHSCGYVRDLLQDFAEIGVTSVWPQLPAYNMEDLAARCRSLGLAVAVHTDRARTMTFGKPDDVRALVLREYETFKLYNGGGWFYIEADNSFPFANIEALVNTIKDLRNG
jgi:hypothetical protein